jgi:hypothetical protein
MTFMVVDIDSYDVLLGLDFLMKIGAIVDVERGLIQVRRGPGTNVEVLPLTVVNLLQNVSSETMERDAAVTLESAPSEILEVDLEKMTLCEPTNMPVSDSDTNADDEGDGGLQSVEPIDDKSEFGSTELEELVLKEGPQQILQLTLQDQADDFMRKDITDIDDYAYWIQWVSDAEKARQASMETARCAEVLALLQINQVSRSDVHFNHKEQLALSNDQKMSTRWEEISQKIRIDHNLEEGKKQQLWKMLRNYQDVFAWNKGELGYCTIGEHFIDTQGFPPCRVSPGRLSLWEEAEVKRQIDVLVDLGKMKPSNSKYACRVTLPIKRDGSRRLCGDYRPLNMQTRRDSFPMPLVDDVISQLGKSTWFTALDLQSGFWQIRMVPEDVKKTTLVTKTGLYDWIVMPFGLKNATSTFTRTMSTIFKELGDKFLKIFVDDLNVHNENWAERLQHLDAVFLKLREVNLKLNLGKCCFAARSITFLGHLVSHEGTKPDPSKINAAVHFPVPKTVTDVRSFLGLIGYYRNYVRGYSRLIVPLFELTRKDVAFVWDLGCQCAFEALKGALVAAPVLIRPDFKKSFCLDVDWSPKGVGAILSQKEGRMERVVAYASKGLTSAQRKFHPMEGECYALIWGIMHFKQYLHRNHFVLRTDHKPLEWLVTVSNVHGRRGRWIDMLQDFSFKILHRPGMKHTNVDALSRNPVGEAADDDDFSEEIQDIGTKLGDSIETT